MDNPDGEQRFAVSWVSKRKDDDVVIVCIEGIEE